MSTKKFPGFLIVFFTVITAAFSQVSVDPEEEFYEDAAIWYAKGYLNSLPLIKPYSIQTVIDIIETVEEKGNEKDKGQASFYRSEFLEKKWSIASESSFSGSHAKPDQDSTDYDVSSESFSAFQESLGLSADVSLGKYVSFSTKDNFVYRSNYDSMSETVPFGSVYSSLNNVNGFSSSSGSGDYYYDPQAVISAGTSRFYGTIGFNKTGFGLWNDDDLILNPSSTQTLNATLNYHGEKISYTQMTALTGAMKYDDEEEFQLKKFMFFHAFRFPLHDGKLNVSYYEAAVFGKFFTPSYLMPVPYAVMGNVDGFNQNLLCGLNLEYKPFNGIIITTDFLLDDLEYKKLLKLHIEDAGIRSAFKAGFIYAPESAVFNQVRLNYTLVSPFCYTKYDTRDENYSYVDYTNFGENLGANLPPDSDRVSFVIDFKPLLGLHFSSSTTFIRHANASEDLSESDLRKYLSSGNGSDLDGSYRMNSKDLDSLSQTSFLNQDHRMYVYQQTVNAGYDLKRTKLGSLSINLSYTFEYVENAGVDRNIFQGITASSTSEEIKNARKLWEDSLYTTYNQYFSARLKLTY